MNSFRRISKSVNFVCACADSSQKIEFGVRYHRITNIWFISSKNVVFVSLSLSISPKICYIIHNYCIFFMFIVCAHKECIVHHFREKWFRLESWIQTQCNVSEGLQVHSIILFSTSCFVSSHTAWHQKSNTIQQKQQQQESLPCLAIILMFWWNVRCIQINV